MAKEHSFSSIQGRTYLAKAASILTWDILKKPFIVTPENAVAQEIRSAWIPASAGMTAFSEYP